MKIPDNEVEIIDETVVAGNMPDEGEDAKEKVDDTTDKENVSKKEEETSTRMKRLEESQERLMKVFTSPEFFAKLGNSMKQEPVKEVKAIPTAEQVQAERDRLEGMSRQEFLSHALSKVSKAATDVVKPEIDKLATQMATFISGQANVAAQGTVKDFIDRVGQAEFDKYGAAMEAKANTTRGNSMDDLYSLVSGKKAPQYPQARIPNKTLKPGEGLREMTEQKDLSLDEASSRNFDHIFGKSRK